MKEFEKEVNGALILNINHFWRNLASGICFLVFGIGGLVLTIIVFPIQNIVYFDRKKRTRIARKTIHYSFKYFINLMIFLGIMDLEIKETSKLKNAEGKVLIANHPSLIDVVILISLIKNADCIVKGALWKNPFVKGAVSGANYISNQCEPETFIDKCNESLNEGSTLVIFPEGTRTVPGQPLRFQRGAGNIAVRCEKDFLPVTIDCDQSFLTKGSKWYQMPKKKPKLVVTIQDAILISEFTRGISASKSSRKVLKAIEEYFKGKLVNYE